MKKLFILLSLIGPAIPHIAYAGDPAVAARWDFGTEEATPLQSHGGVHRDVPGPRPPEYPDFEPNNTAVKLDGNGAHLSFVDPGAKSPFDFANGDAITLESWVQVTDLRPGENVYIIGKGRTGAADFQPDNQNWALRVKETQGKAGVSFLFATVPASGTSKSDSHWHRWTTKDGFQTGSNWHHIAVTYRFGHPESMRGWIDGKPQDGIWDMGGPTKEAPIVDNDAIWIGSARNGAATNSFRGSIDSIILHRQALDDAVMKTRFRFTGTDVVKQPAPEVMPSLGELAPGRTLLTLHEGMPAHDRWLQVGESLPAETLRWETDYILLDRLPQRFDDWGIRQDWNAPVLARMAADVKLTPGAHRFIMRVRGMSRLWVNGTVIARSKPIPGAPHGEEPITAVAKPPLPGLRIAEHRQQEVFGEATIGADGSCRVVLETLVGGKAFRTDPGETCVTVLTNDGRAYILPPSAVQLTDADVNAAINRQEDRLSAFDDRNRRTAAASRNTYWQKRHAIARQWASDHPAPAVPKFIDAKSPDARRAAHPIDAFLDEKVRRASAEAAKTSVAESRHFHSEVLPILRERCFRCHGDKEKGGLRLNSREAALKAGDSEQPAIVAGDPSASEVLRRIRTTDPEERMPPGSNPLSAAEIAVLEAWVKAGATWPAPALSREQVTPSPVIDDQQFLRRVFFDTVGIPPAEHDVRTFLADPSPNKRRQTIDRLLADERWADHWMGYWQDVLAENPTLLNPSLNTTGPFRWFLYDALRDGKSFDRLVTELILLRGSPHEGGSAGFGIAADNDAPFAAKAQILASAFLGIELQCARCHDSPYHNTKQRDLFALAAMFQRKPATVPKTSRVPAAFFEKKLRESLIKVTLRPDEPVETKWPFAELTGCCDDATLDASLENRNDSRERLAALITSPRNTRFAKVIVNRVWRRLIGAGLVEPVHDWEGHAPSHPELLDWLAREFVDHDYDIKHVSRLILTSQIYQRLPTGRNQSAEPERRFFTAPDRRRLSAEQIVDSLLVASGRSLDVEEITFEPDARRPSSFRLTLGIPRCAWMLADLANERDRPSLSLPRARAIVDLMTAFGWSGARQNPRTDREMSPNLLQPGVLANSTASVILTRATSGSGLAELALQSVSPEELVERLFLRYLSRLPRISEREPLAKALSDGFERRVLSPSEFRQPTSTQLPRVTWSNHLQAEATTIAMEQERRARSGPAPDARLRPEWRELYEDVVWSIVNIREFVWLP